MTTRFSNFVRGRFIEAARANFAGLLLDVLYVLQIPWCWWSVYRGRMWKLSQPDVALLWLLLTVCGTCALQWMVRLTVG